MKQLIILISILYFTLGICSCQKAPELLLTGPSSIDMSSEGGSTTFSFTANRDWTISSSDSWVTVSPSKGTASDGAVTVTIKGSANSTYDDRSATVTITMEELRQSVTVRQAANQGIVIPTQSFNLSSEARTIEIEVSSNVQYSVEISANWIKHTGTKGLTTNKLTFSVEENLTYDPREAQITIKPLSGNVPEQVISVNQAQKEAIIINDNSFNMPYGGGEIEFNVESNVSYNVIPNVNWIHFVGTKALSNSTVRLVVDENTTYENREGRITVSQKDGSFSHEITVKQAGRIAVTSITLNKTSIILKEDETETLVATVNPENATDTTILWVSNNPNVATVDNGTVRWQGIGDATISVTAGGISSECKVLCVLGSHDGVSAKYYRAVGAVILNGVVQPGSGLQFGVINYSDETIRVLSVQLVDTYSWNNFNTIPIDEDIVSGSSAIWTITVWNNIYCPKAIFRYVYKGETYTCSDYYRFSIFN